MPRLNHLIPVLAGLALSLATASSAGADQVRLAVAANFTDTARELMAAFTEVSGLQPSASFGSTGKLYAQILHGAPYDVFLAADAHRPALLEDSGAGVAGSRFTYAQGRLVLWSPTPGLLEAPANWLAEGEFNRLAIANPKTAPYGLAAQEVLSRLKLWAPLQPRLVRGDSVAQTFQFVATGNAQAGFVALSQLRAWDGEPGSVWLIPASYYAPINQQAILLARGEGNEAARQWLAFLRSETARRIIEGYGYHTIH